MSRNNLPKHIFGRYINSWQKWLVLGVFLIGLAMLSSAWLMNCLPVPWMWTTTGRILELLLNLLFWPIVLLSIGSVVLYLRALKREGRLKSARYLGVLSTLLSLIGLPLLIMTLMFTPRVCNHLPGHKRLAVKTVRTWAQLDPLPLSANNISDLVIDTTSIKQVQVNFTANAEEVKDWIAKSPGMSNSIAQAKENGSLSYSIQTKGAQSAKLYVSPNGQYVTVWTTWDKRY